MPSKKPKPKPTTVLFKLTAKSWGRVKAACYKDKLYLVSKSFDRHLQGSSSDDHVEIAIPLDLLPKIARACANHGVGVGVGFSTAASDRYVDDKPKKPVDAAVMREAVANAKEELEAME